MGTKSNYLDIATSLIPIRKIKKLDSPNTPNSCHSSDFTSRHSFSSNSELQNEFKFDC